MVTNYFITNIESVMDMIKKNIFRPLPSTNRNNVALGVSETGVEEEEQEPDPSWVHIRGIYAIFLKKKKKSTNFVEPVLPFNDGYVLSDYNSVYKNIYNKEKYLND